MSTAPLRFEGSIEEEPEGPPLRRGPLLLLLPLLLLGAFGLFVPLRAVEFPAGPVEREAGPRVPYDGALEELVRREDLDLETRRVIRDEHERLLAEEERHGGISEKDARRVARFLQRYR